jgi:hypothetical protein
MKEFLFAKKSSGPSWSNACFCTHWMMQARLFRLSLLYICCCTRHGTAVSKCSNKSVLIGMVDIPWCMTRRCFRNWRPASEDDDFGRVSTSCLLVTFRRRCWYCSQRMCKIYYSVKCDILWCRVCVFLLLSIGMNWYFICSTVKHRCLFWRKTLTSIFFFFCNLSEEENIFASWRC